MRTLVETQALKARFIGKTIQRIQIPGVNTWIIHFTDGSSEELWAEQAVRTDYGSIPGIFLKDELS